MNDAPALKKANVGIAVAGATAAAKGAADIILTEVYPRLLYVVEAPHGCHVAGAPGIDWAAQQQS